MAYNYQIERPTLFTEDGQIIFLKIRDKSEQLLSTSGAFKLDKAIQGVGGDSWQMIACIDRLVELGEILEIPRNCAGQNRVFISSNRSV